MKRLPLGKLPIIKGATPRTQLPKVEYVMVMYKSKLRYAEELPHSFFIKLKEIV
jgi:hypothetical protein